MNCFLGVPAIAVGLSAISFSASLQKDAAPIPNALAATNSMSSLLTNKALPYPIFVSPLQGSRRKKSISLDWFNCQKPKANSQQP